MLTTSFVNVVVSADNTNLFASISTQSQVVTFDTTQTVSFSISLANYTNLKNFMFDVHYDRTMLSLQNTASDSGVDTLRNDGNGNLRMIVSLPSPATSATANQLFVLTFKMLSAAQDQTTTVILNDVYAGISTGIGQEIEATVQTGSVTVHMGTNISLTDDLVIYKPYFSSDKSEIDVYAKETNHLAPQPSVKFIVGIYENGRMTRVKMFTVPGVPDVGLVFPLNVGDMGIVGSNMVKVFVWDNDNPAQNLPLALPTVLQ